jgi:GT2 family glycosyltransferase
MLEDGDFGYTIRENGGKIWYSPMPTIEHLRIPTGGTRSDSASKGMYFRAHNTVYFMRKHGMIKNMIPGLFYLNGVALKDLLRKKHGITAIFWCWYGFLKGLTITLSR